MTPLPPTFTRRELLARTGLGFGGAALAQLLRDTGGLTPQLAAGEMNNPLAPKPPQFPVKAKHVIHLFMNGGPSHIDTFDPKPALKKWLKASSKTADADRTARLTGWRARAHAACILQAGDQASLRVCGG